jgi:glycosyltransferase involved in cell wall biosynthesis
MLSRAVPASRQVLWGHGLARNPVLNRVRLQMARRAGAVVLYDRSGIEGLLAGGVDEAVISVAPNTVSVSNAGVDADVKRTQFLFVGRLQSRKGIEEAFRAFEALVPHIAEDIRFKVIGTGEHGAALRDHARRSGISDRIEFVPATTNSTYLKTEFQRSLAYVSPAHVGLGVLHSFAYGVPVITAAQAAHAPEFYNIVHNTNGLLVGPRVEDLMEAMRTVANSPAHSIELGRRGFELYIKHRRMDQMVGAMRDVISKTIDNDKRQSEVILRKAS